MTTQSFTGIRRQLRKRVPLAGGGKGFTTVPDGYEVADVKISIDMAAVAHQCGIKAMSNKSGQCKYMGGAVVVTILRRSREEG